MFIIRIQRIKRMKRIMEVKLQILKVIEKSKQEYGQVIQAKFY